MEQYENLMKLFRRECQYAGAARWVLDATLQDLSEAGAYPALSEAGAYPALILRLKLRIESLDIEYNSE